MATAAPVALVTGASRGIGRAVAVALAARGTTIAVHYRSNQSAAEQTLELLAGSGHRSYPADLSDPQAIERLVGDVQAQLGPIAILVNNAAIFEDHPPLSTSYGDWQAAWQRVLGTNLQGPANLSLLAAQAMVRSAPTARGRGRIVNISSRGAFRGEPDAPAYGASKAGLNALSQSLAKALAPQQVYVYCLAPGWVETEMASAHLTGPGAVELIAQHPLGRVASPAEVADAAAYCALDAPAAMTGSIIDINGASYLRT